MHEDIVAAVVVGNESKPFSVIEPFNSSVHYYTSWRGYRILNPNKSPKPYLLYQNSRRLSIEKPKKITVRDTFR